MIVSDVSAQRLFSIQRNRAVFLPINIVRV
jgi:hypothetical protein